MNKIQLRQLKFGKHNIHFCDGVNYIKGKNASGKTTIFNMIQYILGVKKDIGYSMSGSDILELKVSINEIEFVFHRRIEENRVSIETDSQKISFNINSREYSSFLFDAFDPKFENEIEPSVIKILIKESFNSSITDQKYFRSDDKFLILGINKRYENQIKKDIKELKEDIRIKKIALDKVKSYKNEVSKLVKHSIANELQEITEILNRVYEEHGSDYGETYDVYQKSQVLFEKLQFDNEERTEDLLRELDDFYQELINSFCNFSLSLKEALFNKVKYWSGGESGLINMILKTVIQSKSDTTNGIGLLVCDDAILGLDHEAIYRWRKIIHNTCKKENLQYIEFIGDGMEISNEDIIYELERGSLYA